MIPNINEIPDEEFFSFKFINQSEAEIDEMNFLKAKKKLESLVGECSWHLIDCVEEL